MHLIVGLGNPGEQYEYSRHNIGFKSAQKFAADLKLKWKKEGQGLIARGKFEEKALTVLLPLTFMNNSGAVVKPLVDREEIPPKNILLICDDVNLDFGQFRLRAEGSDGGHNGLSSVLGQLNTKEVARLRIGVGVPPKGRDLAEYVLGNFKARELKELGEITAQASLCCQAWLTENFQKVMNEFNAKAGQKE